MHCPANFQRLVVGGAKAGSSDGGLATGRYVNSWAVVISAERAAAEHSHRLHWLLIPQRSTDDFPPDDFRRMIPKFNFPHISALVDKLKVIGNAHKGATPAQVTIARLLAQGPDIIPIPVSTQIKYVEENLGALDIELTDEEVHKIRELCDEVEKHLGADPLWPEWDLKMSWVDTPLPTP